MAACRDGDLEKTQKLIEHSTIHPLSFQVWFVYACRSGNLELVRFLKRYEKKNERLFQKLRRNLFPKEREKHQDDVSIALAHACQSGHLAVAQYLLTSPSLTLHASLHFNNNHALMCCVAGGHTDLLRYLLTSPLLLKRWGNSATFEDDGGVTHTPELLNALLEQACFSGHRDITRYLLESRELHRHAVFELHRRDDILCYACLQGHEKLAFYLLDLYPLELLDGVTEKLSKIAPEGKETANKIAILVQKRKMEYLFGDDNKSSKKRCKI